MCTMESLVEDLRLLCCMVLLSVLVELIQFSEYIITIPGISECGEEIMISMEIKYHPCSFCTHLVDLVIPQSVSVQ